MLDLTGHVLMSGDGLLPMGDKTEAKIDQDHSGIRALGLTLDWRRINPDAIDLQTIWP